MNLNSDEVRGIKFFAGEGCEKCNYTGFKGRIGIFEYIFIDDDIRREITAKSSSERIKAVAVEKGMLTLRQDGWDKVRKGITTVSEVLKVTLEK